MTRLARPARSRIAFGSRYSSESYQRFACSRLGNSSTTTRFGFQSPSTVWWAPPRTRNRPPYLASVAGTCLRYSSMVIGSVTTRSTMTYAAMMRLPRAALLRGLRGRGRETAHELVADLLLDARVDRLDERLECLQVLHLVDLGARLLHDVVVLLLALDLVPPVHRARLLHRLAHDLLQIRRQRLISLQVHEVADRRIRVPGERVVLGDLLELVGGHGEGRQLHAVDGALLHGQVHLDVRHRHRVGPERRHERHVGGRLLDPHGQALHVLRRVDRPLVDHHVAEAPAPAEAEPPDALGVHSPEQLLADRTVHHLPHLLPGGPEERQVERLVHRVEHAAD